MTQEEKFLLLQDLCARLPHGVIVKTPQGDGYLNEVSLTIFGHELGVNIKATERTRFKLEECKPYLRSLSSMTGEEKKELGEISCEGNIEHKYGIFYRSQDYLNSIHVDYRGLIEKGLALEAPEGMYEY